MQSFKDFHQRTLRILTLIIIAFSISSCTQNQQIAEKENKIVERIGAEVAFYQFHFKYGATRMGEVITAAEELLEAMRNPDVQLTEEQIELR